ncbi:phosphoribosylaminoimidazole-succinocarboxamide synthase [Candidatus Magnetomorum sp. HK-1]|nr:phosphoribosylaminoimidazole-succinocarboxamide synthase [Candidatus Magnetomorum sp. HK-1]
MQKKIEIYQSKDDEIRLQVQLNKDTVWLNRQQLSILFNRDIKTIGKHINNVFKEGEVDKGSTVANFATVQNEGGRQVERQIEHYNLDVIISVGYRVKSQQGTRFRIWATKRLKEYLIKGYTINKERLEQNSYELEQALKLIQKTVKTPELDTNTGRGLVEIVSLYTQTFLWLQRYDEGLLEEPPGQNGGILLTPDEGISALEELKNQLVDQGDATAFFAHARGDGLVGIFGNLNQTIFGEPAYPTIESKAAHLLYFIVKNHPFTDGNKRCAAYLFVDFLHRNNRLFNSKGLPIINDTGLAAITLLVAESDPNQKDTIIHLVMNLLGRIDT